MIAVLEELTNKEANKYTDRLNDIQLNENVSQNKFSYQSIVNQNHITFEHKNHRVGIEWKSPYKESYTVNSHWKSFDDVMGDVRACVRFQN